MNGYNAIAGVYDSINSGVDYRKWADYIESNFNKYLKNRPMGGKIALSAHGPRN
jgi:hypothetical protein